MLASSGNRTINVITRKAFDEPGLHVAASTGLAIDSSDRVSNYADHFRYLADLSSFYQGPESRYSISLRYEAGALSSIVEDSESSQIRYLSDPKIWSPEVIDTYFDPENPFSDDRSLALDLRYASKARFILEGELETGLTMLSTLRGRGLQYTDRLSPSFRTEVDAPDSLLDIPPKVIICTRRACSGGDKIASSQPTYTRATEAHSSGYATYISRL